MRYVMTGTVAKVVERTRKQWLGGIGNAATFGDVGDGWTVQLKEWPTAAIELGAEKPPFSEGDRVRLTLELLP